jgi:hypothetical protein
VSTTSQFVAEGGAPTRPARIIVEGVTGAGKSSLLQALGARSDTGRNAIVVPEEETLGEFMSEELLDSGASPSEKLWRLTHVLEKVKAAPAEQGLLLERFHPTYYALVPSWPLYQQFDSELALLGFRLVLLTIPETALRTRCLFRGDRSQTAWSQGMVDYYGSLEAALTAISDSQQRRLEVLDHTATPALTIDTSEMMWADYSDRVAQVCKLV